MDRTLRKETRRLKDGAPATSVRDRILRTERTMVRIRWGGFFFAIVQIATFYRPYPRGVQTFAYGVATVLLLWNIASWRLLKKIGDERKAARLSAISFLADGLVIMSLVWIYTFDPETAIWALIYVIPLEGAKRFGLRGALVGMTLAALTYSVREIYGSVVFGNELLPTSITFRMGIGFIIAGVAGTMARDLESDREQLQSVLERERAVREVLQKEDEIKSDFLANVAHELRTPVTSVMGLLNTVNMRWDQLDEGMRRHLLTRSEEVAVRLAEIVDELLDFSLLESGTVELHKTNFNLRDLIGGVTESLGTSGGASHSVHIELAGEFIINADEKAIRRVLENLLSNAAKFSRPPTPIVIRAEDKEGSVTITVIDQGPGIPERDLERIFERFHRVDRGDTVPSGAGIGLAIAKDLVVAHGGAIWAANLPGGGSAFSFTLPGVRRSRIAG